jgi:hypothetical protein
VHHCTPAGPYCTVIVDQRELLRRGHRLDAQARGDRCANSGAQCGQHRRIVAVADAVPVAHRNRETDAVADVPRSAGHSARFVDVRHPALYPGVMNHQVCNAVAHRTREGGRGVQVRIGAGNEAEKRQPAFQRPVEPAHA